MSETEQPRCEDCEGPVPVWFAPNPLWNLVKGGPEATDDPGGFLCLNCFVIRAEAAGIRPTAWVLDQEHLKRESTTELVSSYIRGRRLFCADDVARAYGDRPRKEIYNALTYLKRTGAVRRVGYGRYEAAP
jgi:hypothetical protein